MATRILIADDSPVVRQCLARILGSRLGWEVCGEALNGEEVVRKAQELVPDLIIMDFMMPGKNGIDAAREISKFRPGIPILLCSVFLTPQLVDLARLAGIAGTLSKGDLNKVIPCVDILLQGGTFFLPRSQPSGNEIAAAAPVSRPSLHELTDSRTFDYLLHSDRGKEGSHHAEFPAKEHNEVLGPSGCQIRSTAH